NPCSLGAARLQMVTRKYAVQVEGRCRRFFCSTSRIMSGVTRRLNPRSSKNTRTGVPVIQLLEWWSIPRRGWIIILTELVVIISLGSWVYAEYLSNSYFQSYINSLSPAIVPIISVAFGIASATVATLLYFTMRSIRQREGARE